MGYPNETMAERSNSMCMKMGLYAFSSIELMLLAKLAEPGRGY